MNPVFKEYVFDFKDLNLMSIVCIKCGAEIIHDMARKELLNLSPSCQFCPSCNDNYGPLFSEALTSLHKVYRHLTDKSARATVRIRIRREVNVAEF
jgi:hypothetical protein